MRSPVSFLPIITTLVAFAFSAAVFRRYRGRGGMHLLWWGIGLAMYGVGAGTESLTTLFGWNPGVFRAWYVTGALLGGAPLAQGSVYLITSPKLADRLAIALVAVVALGAALVCASPIDYALVEPYRLTGRVLEWQWVRLVSPFVNSYALVFLAVGAIASAVRYSRRWGTKQRVLANVYIALGGLLPGIGGSFTRFGHTEVLYATELLGLLLIYAGYRASLRAAIPSRILMEPGPAGLAAMVLVR